MRGGVDSHVHVIDPDRFPYAAGANYRPLPKEYGDVDALLTTLEEHGLYRALVVQPSCYGFDNSALLDALARAPDRLRGIAALPPDIAENEAASLRDRGVVGVRLNMVQFRQEVRGPSAARFFGLVRELDWWVEVFAKSADWPEVAPPLQAERIRMLVDHLGMPEPARGPDQPGFATVLRLGREGRACVKLSAPYRASRLGPPYADLVPFVSALIEAFGPEGCIWGSDWPFINTPMRPRYEDQLSALSSWFQGAPARERMLRDVPERLFGFRRPDRGDI